MKKLIYLNIASISFLFFGCSGSEKPSEVKELKKPSCFYSYNESSSVLEWTAFKFTEKKGVTGTFNEIDIQGIEKSDDPKEVIESLTFSINTPSVETSNEERNQKIATLFFGTISTPVIKGQVKRLGGDGKAVLEIEMNKIKRDVQGNYSLENGLFSFKSTIDVLDWKGAEGIEKLNTACKDLHTGADGKSKLWSTVDISFTTELLSDCE